MHRLTRMCTIEYMLHWERCARARASERLNEIKWLFVWYVYNEWRWYSRRRRWLCCRWFVGSAIFFLFWLCFSLWSYNEFNRKIQKLSVRVKNLSCVVAETRKTLLLYVRWVFFFRFHFIRCFCFSLLIDSCVLCPCVNCALCAFFSQWFCTRFFFNYFLLFLVRFATFLFEKKNTLSPSIFFRSIFGWTFCVVKMKNRWSMKKMWRNGVLDKKKIHSKRQSVYINHFVQ